MTTALTVGRSTTLQATDGFINGEQLKARMDLILDVAKHVMVENIDFGKIPGTDKPSLWKPGAEKLCVAFRVAVGEPSVEDISTTDEVRYRVHVPGVSQVSGVLLGVGVGECSTGEKKYKWRYPVHPNEFAATAVDRRREVFKRDGTTYQQVRTDPADLANTVLKMAHKRAMVAMALVVTGASAIFSQDLEDLPEEMRETVAGEGQGASERKRPQRSSASKGSATPASVSHPVTGPVTITAVDKRQTKSGKDQWWIKASDGQAYSTFSETDGKEMESFAGTDHAVLITYEVKQVGDKQYRNFVSVAVADVKAAAATPAAAPSPSPAQPELTDADFGDFK